MTKQKMTQKAKEILPIIQALAEGKDVIVEFPWGGSRYTEVPGTNCRLEEFLSGVNIPAYKVKPPEYYLVKTPDGQMHFFNSKEKADHYIEHSNCCEIITLIEKP